MNFSSISDLHIKEENDKGHQLLKAFVSSQEVLKSDTVYFLGDIFDFMVGDKKQYLEKYSFFFKELEKLTSQGKRVYYIEGNHDFHLSSIMQSAIQKFGINKNLFTHSDHSMMLEKEGKIYFFSHGHEIDRNISYQKWKSIYSSRPFRFFVNNMLPYSVVEFLGNKASKDSKKRGMKSFVYNKSKKMYREGALEFIQRHNIDYLITGHTHIEECVKLENCLFINNGFPQTTNKFIYFKDNKAQLISLI